MLHGCSVYFVTVVLLLCADLISGQRKISRHVPVTTNVKTGVDFDCPEEFGYYPHPTDCTQYYVCVFGGALLESCTGGLMYSHELQTCDWPRNVGCEPASDPQSAPSPTPAPSTSRNVETSRVRYIAPSPTAATVAVVSRGQPRQQIQQNKHEIAKQRQQQLYAETEETLPPAEEIENDRQQRVYRGQPATIGQVQRDRDGIRNSNSISGSAGRGDKVGVINFGTHQLSQYRYITDQGDYNDLTVKKRLKRQLHQSSGDWRPISVVTNRELRPEQRLTYKPVLNRYITPPLQNQHNENSHNFNSYQPHLNTRSNDNNKNQNGMTKAILIPNTQYYSGDSKTEGNHLKSVHQITPKLPSRISSAAQYKTESILSSEKIKYNDTKPPVFGESYKFQYYTPPTYSPPENKYRHIENPFADPNFDFDKFLDNLRQDKSSPYFASVKSTHPPLVKSTPPSKGKVNIQSSDKKIISGESIAKQIHYNQNPNVPIYDDYYYYDDDDENYEDEDYVAGKNKNDTVKTSTQKPRATTTPKKLITQITKVPNAMTTTDRIKDRTFYRLRPNNSTNINRTIYRIEDKTQAPVVIQSLPTESRNNYNSSQNYEAAQYDPYYTLYEDDVDLYRDVEYTQQYNNNNQNQQQTYRSTAAPIVQTATVSEELPRRGTPAVNLYSSQQNVYQQPSSPGYSKDVYYTNQDDKVYRQSNKQSLREEKNEINFIEEPTHIKRTTTTSTTTSRPSTTQKYNRSSSRNNVRGRGSAHYTTAGVSETVPVNRGTLPPRSRPTLKPSTSIVSKASEFFDIYKYPPRRAEPIYPTPQPDKTAAKCRRDVCLLPDCSCGGKDIPGGLPVEQVPQIVLLTFDDSVNDLNKGLYSDLFEQGRVNPNGCPIAATFYVSHEWTDYSQVQNLYSDGHEIASHTVSHSFGEQFSQKKWTKEVAGQREILAAYGGVHLEDVRGMRAPFLSVGGNKMFKMLYDSNFTYDSSMPIYENRPPSWPYTLDYKLFHDCMIPPCPTRSYPGVWEVPMVMWQDLNGGRCSMGDACSNPPEADGVFKMLLKNFERHYTTNRAPFGLFYHAAWFTQPHHKEGFINFLDTINSMKDVWLVTSWQAVQWVRDPTPISRLNSFQPFSCNYQDRPKRCNNPKVCNLWHKTGVRYMRTCQPCPDIYPWTGNTGIRSSRIDNDIED